MSECKECKGETYDSYSCPWCGTFVSTAPKEPQPSQGGGAEDAAWKHAVEEFEHRRGFTVSPTTWKDRQYGVELRLSKEGYLIGYAAGRASQDARIGELEAQVEGWNIRAVAAENTVDTLKAQLAEAQKELENKFSVKEKHDLHKRRFEDLVGEARVNGGPLRLPEMREAVRDNCSGNDGQALPRSGVSDSRMRPGHDEGCDRTYAPEVAGDIPGTIEYWQEQCGRAALCLFREQDRSVSLRSSLAVAAEALGKIAGWRPFAETLKRNAQEMNDCDLKHWRDGNAGAYLEAVRVAETGLAAMGKVGGTKEGER